MLSQAPSSQGSLNFISIPPDSTLGKVLRVVESCLAAFPENFPISLANRGVGLAEVDENDFNIEFAHWLSLEFQRSALGPFTVPPQYPERRQKKRGLPPSVDIAVREAGGKRILALEGKRLHNRSDRQYVSGKTGGIARFKREQHGKELSFACMIGYVQTESFAFWHQKINGWIRAEQTTLDLIWNSTDLLTEPETIAQHLACCQSRHQRMTQNPIELRHFWVKVA